MRIRWEQLCVEVDSVTKMNMREHDRKGVTVDGISIVDEETVGENDGNARR